MEAAGTTSVVEASSAGGTSEVAVAVRWAGCATGGGATAGGTNLGEDRRVTSVQEEVVEGSPSGGGGVGGSPPLGG